MKEVAQGKKSLKIIFWNPREIRAEAATTIVDMEDDAEGESRSIGEFLGSLPEEKRVAVRKIFFVLTFMKNHERPYSQGDTQEIADAIGLPITVYVCERGYHTAPNFQFHVDPR